MGIALFRLAIETKNSLLPIQRESEKTTLTWCGNHMRSHLNPNLYPESNVKNCCRAYLISENTAATYCPKKMESA